MHVWLRSEPLISCAINYPISHHINASVSLFLIEFGSKKTKEINFDTHFNTKI